MKLIQGPAALGVIALAYAGTAGQCVAQRLTATIPADAAIGDIVEISFLMNGCRPVDMVVDVDSDVSGDIGILSGNFGDEDDTRTCGSQFGAAVALKSTEVWRPEAPSAFRISTDDHPRGVGLKITTAPAAEVTIGITLTVVA